MSAIVVRLTMHRGRVRVRCVQNGLFVQCPRDWRDRLPAGRPFEISAALRSDGKCYVAARGGYK